MGPFTNTTSSTIENRDQFLKAIVFDGITVGYVRCDDDTWLVMHDNSQTNVTNFYTMRDMMAAIVINGDDVKTGNTFSQYDKEDILQARYRLRTMAREQKPEPQPEQEAPTLDQLVTQPEHEQATETLTIVTTTQGIAAKYEFTNEEVKKGCGVTVAGDVLVPTGETYVKLHMTELDGLDKLQVTVGDNHGVGRILTDGEDKLCCVSDEAFTKPKLAELFELFGTVKEAVKNGN